MLRELIALPMESKVWIYQADRELTYDEVDEVRLELFDFAQAWSSHGTPVDAYANVFHRRFFVFVADEANLGVSGCSIDSSVHLVKSIDSRFGLNLFDRLLYTYLDEEEYVQTIHHIDFRQSYEANLINKETLMFDNLVATKSEFLNDWLKPLAKSWHAKFVAL
jgi:hypothetical protein